MEKLRFAPIIRVSTEGQEKQGESLRTQKAQILQYVQALGGVLPGGCWQYSGQEHATVDYERAKLDQLLSDSDKGLFDAVIVCDVSRWSRDNEKSKAGLKIFKKNGIRFFVGTTEFDLFNPEKALFLGMATEMNEYFAMTQAHKSIWNRIGRAKRGIPTSGKLPYGRTFDKLSGQWGVDPEKQQGIQWAAEQYLAGVSFEKISAALGVNNAALWKTIRDRCGTDWECRFRNKRLNIDETVIIKMPPLLPEETIEAIRQQALANKTYQHGEIKNKYLLSRMVFCGSCGFAMFGQTNHGDRRYYRHPRKRNIKCDEGFWVVADDIEEAVTLALFRMYGDVAGLEAAMLRAIPNNEEAEGLRAEAALMKRRLAETGKAKDRLVNAIAEGVLSGDEAKKKMDEFRAAEAACSERLAAIFPQLAEVPTAEAISRNAKLVQRATKAYFKTHSAMLKMSYEAKRQLIETVFGGRDAEGKRLGVYVSKGGAGRVKFEIRGVLATAKGAFPVSEEELLRMTEYERSLYVKQDSFSKRHAHHRFGFYQR